MDIVAAIELFKTGAIRGGKTFIAMEFFKFPLEKQLCVLKTGYLPFEGDFFILVCILAGYSYETIRDLAGAIKSFSLGGNPVISHKLFDRIDIAIVKIDTTDPVLATVGMAMIVLSNDNGETWSGTFKGRCRTAPMSFWVDRYYQTVLNEIKFDPGVEFFNKDFRVVGVFRPYQDKFVIQERFIADKRDLSDIMLDCSRTVATPVRVDGGHPKRKFEESGEFPYKRCRRAHEPFGDGRGWSPSSTDDLTESVDDGDGLDIFSLAEPSLVAGREPHDDWWFSPHEGCEPFDDEFYMRNDEW